MIQVDDNKIMMAGPIHSIIFDVARVIDALAFKATEDPNLNVEYDKMIELILEGADAAAREREGGLVKELISTKGKQDLSNEDVAALFKEAEEVMAGEKNSKKMDKMLENFGQSKIVTDLEKNQDESKAVEHFKDKKKKDKKKKDKKKKGKKDKKDKGLTETTPNDFIYRTPEKLNPPKDK